MKRIITLLLLSFALSLGSSEAFADRHHEKNRHEQRDRKHDKKHGKRKHDRKHDRHSRPAPGHHMAPPPPPPPRRHHAHMPPPPPRLPYMVSYATRGCHDVNVWQVSDDTFIVKYRRGNRFYTRMLYPYAERYGDVNTISVNWQPASPWTLIPPIQLNINL